MQGDMIPFYILSLLLIALPSTTTDVINEPYTRSSRRTLTISLNATTPPSLPPNQPLSALPPVTVVLATTTATANASAPATSKASASATTSVTTSAPVKATTSAPVLLPPSPPTFMTNGSVGNDMKKTVESLQFRLETIETATNKFSDDNKLGEGGFGAVFKV
ncbi:unnamed protein product [Malus baccata var. baccata]